jgi:SAM-dependent methyltransferase
MLDAVRRHGRDRGARLLRADVLHLPLSDACLDAVFAAGLMPVTGDPTRTLTELARVTRSGGRLILFHPSGCAALEVRHGRQLEPTDTLAHGRLEAALTATGWRLGRYDDADHRFFALADRAVGPDE